MISDNNLNTTKRVVEKHNIGGFKWITKNDGGNPYLKMLSAKIRTAQKCIQELKTCRMMAGLFRQGFQPPITNASVRKENKSISTKKRKG